MNEIAPPDAGASDDAGSSDVDSGVSVDPNRPDGGTSSSQDAGATNDVDESGDGQDASSFVSSNADDSGSAGAFVAIGIAAIFVRRRRRA